MNTKVLRKMRYENTFIYVLQFHYFFQYLFSFNGEIYRDEIILKPTTFRKWKYKLGLVSDPYSLDEFDEGEKAVLSGALASIDKLIAEGKLTRQSQRAREREYKEIQADVIARTGKPCLWQAIESREGFYYRCLTHGMAVKMVDGQKPVHDVLSPLQLNG